MQTEIAATTSRPAYLVEIGFTGTTLRLSSLKRDISWNSQTWLGNGWFLQYSPINETADIRAAGMEFQLVGIPSSLLALALANADQNQDAILYLAMMNSSGAVIADPITLFKGKVDTVELTDSIDQPTILIKCESSLARLERPQNFRYTDGNQKALFTGDLGFQYLPVLEDWTGYWGKAERPKWLQRRRRANR